MRRSAQKSSMRCPERRTAGPSDAPFPRRDRGSRMVCGQAHLSFGDRQRLYRRRRHGRPPQLREKRRLGPSGGPGYGSRILCGCRRAIHRHYVRRSFYLCRPPVCLHQQCKSAFYLPCRRRKNGTDGKNGKDGKDGVGIAKAEIDESGALILTFTDGRTVDLGRVIGADGKDGLSPFIGENGDRWIGEKDTGARAAADAAAAADPASTSAASPALIAVGAVAGPALIGDLGLLMYIVRKKKKNIV